MGDLWLRVSSLDGSFVSDFLCFVCFVVCVCVLFILLFLYSFVSRSPSLVSVSHSGTAAPVGRPGLSFRLGRRRSGARRGDVEGDASWEATGGPARD